MSRSEQERIRRDARQSLEEMGVEPYPHKWDVTAHAADILDEFDDERRDPDEGERMNVSIAGRIRSLRVMGGSAFMDVQDESGTVQAYVRKGDLPEGVYDKLVGQHLDIGDLVGVRGHVFRTNMGEVTVRASDTFKLLSKALRPLPTPKEKEGETFNEVTDKELRYRQRYVDLIVNPDVREVFRQRAQLLSEMRDFLNERDFLEVETPALQPVYGGATARPFTTHHNALDMKLYLRIADELYLKRLLVGGLEGVYEIAKDFRNEGLSRFHNPEFTMMELYVAYKDYRWMMELTEKLFARLATKLHGGTTITFDGEDIALAPPFRRLPLFEAIEEHTGRDCYGMNEGELRDVARELNLEIDEAMGKGKLIDEIFSETVEPNLTQPTFITDYPVELSPLAKKHPDKEGLVERFELIVAGNELCNAFSELNDPDDQRARFEEQARLRAEGDGEAAPIDEDYLRALEYGMPPAAGLGIGIDRLTMLMTDQRSIRDVILFPLLRPESDAPE